MSRWEHRHLGLDRFPETLSELEIDFFFTLDDAEAAAVRERRRPVNRLALALQIGFLKMTGRTLNSVELVPPAVLTHLGRQLGVAAPRIASIRALYRRRRTLFDHQAAAVHALGRSDATEHAKRGLVAHLRREAIAVFDLPELMARARVWLVDHHYLLPRERDLRHLAVEALRHRGEALTAHIAMAAPAEHSGWVAQLLAPVEPGGASHLEWLRTTPSGKGTKSLEEQLAKIHVLKMQSADRLVFPDLPLAGLEHHAKRVLAARPATLPRIREPRRTIAIACFLRLCLLRLTDASLTLLDYRIAALWREAQQRAKEARASRLRRFRGLLGDLMALEADKGRSDAEVRAGLGDLLAPFAPERDITQVAEIRQELAKESSELARLIRLARSAELAVPANHTLAAAFATLDRLGAAVATALPAGTTHPFGPSWQSLIDQSDRKDALGCFVAATTMVLKRALRNRSVSVDHSLSFKPPEDKLIPAALWQRDRNRLLRDLALPGTAAQFLPLLEAGLSDRLQALAVAVEAGEVAIERGGIRLPRRAPAPKDPRLAAARRTLAEAIGSAQLSEIMIEIDGLTRFSWTLLGRPARSETELATLYAGLLGLGSDLSVAELARMTPSVSADSLEQMVLKIEADGRLRAASDAVLGFMRSHRVATLWGRGLFASADMMSLEATRYLWSARLDPRRRTYAVGTYAHVLDQWGILYDQPIVLNRRQAGAAIEGALRQKQVGRLERVAVDTHGFTYFAMAAGKSVGFDLCPRVAKLTSRKLHLPRGFDVPEILRPIVSADAVSRRAISRGWDGFLRLGASLKGGWYPATEALDRFGAAARGDPVYEAGDALGRLLFSLYHCDFLANRVFRTEILDLLNQGEAVHSLQRAIHNGMIPAKRGRTNEQLTAISGALTLLANIVMAWNTLRIQQVADQGLVDLPDGLVRHIAPIRHENINLNGILSFDFSRHGASLLGGAPIVIRKTKSTAKS